MRTILQNPLSNDDIMRDFHDILFCREHGFFSDPRNISLLLYVDECEIANPLGSKAGLHKIGTYEVYVARWCIVHGIKYCKNLHVITAKSDDSTPFFQRIIYVIVTDSTSIKLVTQEWDTVKYDRHTHTHAIQQPSTSRWSVLQFEDLNDYYPYHASKSYNDRDPLSYVVMRHRVH